MFAAVLAKGKKMNSNIKGFVYGIATSATFGLIPLFTLPLMAKGMQFDMFLFWGYNFMSAGIATTLHFTYPIFVTLIMLLFFREKTSWVTLLAIGLAICGVARLSINEG